MDGITLLAQAQSAGLTVMAQGDKLVVRGPRSAEVLAMELLEHKTEIMELLWKHKCKVGDGQLPPLVPPPENETELRRLIDYLGDPVAFSTWFEALMSRTDPAEAN